MVNKPMKRHKMTNENCNFCDMVPNGFLSVVFGKCVDDFTKSRTRCGEEVHFKQFSIESK